MIKKFMTIGVWSAGILLAFIITTNLLIYLATLPFIYKNTKDIPTVQVALIPGAAVRPDGSISQIFKERVDAALGLYEAKTVSKILVSGDNSTVAHNEVNPVRDYLLEKGIPDRDIYLDHAGFDTYSTMYRARDIFKVSSVVISSQLFHLPRAVFIARALGIPAYGVSADSGETPSENYVREVFANVKAAYNLIFHTKPKFLGEPIPIK